MKEAKSNLCLGLGPSTVELWFLADSVGAQQIKLLKAIKHGIQLNEIAMKPKLPNPVTKE